MEHPFVDPKDIHNMNIEQVQKKLSELYRILGFAHRSGNAMLCSQLHMAIESYQTVYNQKIDAALPKPKDGDGDDNVLIDIS